MTMVFTGESYGLSVVPKEHGIIVSIQAIDHKNRALIRTIAPLHWIEDNGEELVDVVQLLDSYRPSGWILHDVNRQWPFTLTAPDGTVVLAGNGDCNENLTAFEQCMRDIIATFDTQSSLPDVLEHLKAYGQARMFDHVR